MPKRVRSKVSLQEPASSGATQKVRLGFARSARVIWDKLPPSVQGKLREKLRNAALNPESAKPLTGELAGCRRVTYGRVRCVARIADGLAVLVVIEIGKRKQGDGSDPYTLAVDELRSGKSGVQEQFMQLTAEAIREMRDRAK